ncbi:MAG: cyclic nucleotide-binding domain-containing protein, partial [Burkholderiales bacterium]
MELFREQPADATLKAEGRPGVDRGNNQIHPKTFLANLPLFKELSPEELDRIALATRQVRAERGEILFHRGDAATGFYVVVYGQVK